MGISPRGFPCFLLAGDTVGNAPIGSQLYFGHFAKCLRYSLSIAEKVSNPLWAFPKESPIPSRFSNGLQELLSAFPNVSRHIFGHFLYMSLYVFLFINTKIRRNSRKILKPPAVLHSLMIYPTIPLVVTLKLMQQSL